MWSVSQMLGVLPGVPFVHITYVHLAVAALLYAFPYMRCTSANSASFLLMWNRIVTDQPSPSKEPSSSSSSPKKEEKKEDKRREKEKQPEREPTPWDDERAHPSAFLTTRLNRYLPWPFPMGNASKKGNELWWESGTPTHV